MLEENSGEELDTWEDSSLPTISECEEADTQWGPNPASEATSPEEGPDTDQGETELRPSQSPPLGLEKTREERAEDQVTLDYIQYAINALQEAITRLDYCKVMDLVFLLGPLILSDTAPIGPGAQVVMIGLHDVLRQGIPTRTDKPGTNSLGNNGAS